MKTRYCSPERAIEPGRSAELPEDEALDLIDKGFAVPYDGEAAERVEQLRTRVAKKAAGRKSGQPAATGGGQGDGGAGGG
jgi:hypothetical protein